METDPEVKGEGNSYSTYFRQLDVRVGRWLSIDPKMNAFDGPFTTMGNNPNINTDINGDRFKGFKTKVYVRRFQANINARLISINNAIINENASATPDPTRIAALQTMQQRLNDQTRAINQLSGSSMVFRIKESSAYPGSNFESLNHEYQPDGDFGVNQMTKEGLMYIHPDADDFNITMSNIITKAAIFENGEMDMSSDLYNSVTFTEGTNLYDQNDVRKILRSSTPWEMQIVSPQLNTDLSNLDNIVERTIQRSYPKVHSEDRRLYNDIPDGGDGFGSDGDKGSLAAQVPTSWVSWLKSPAFNTLGTVIYDKQDNVIYVPKSTDMRTNNMNQDIQQK